MKVVILAGGFGTRISEESYLRPKPMIEIGGNPILWHIMKIYSYYGHNDFIICCGYKGNMIKEYFANYYMYKSDITFDFTNENNMQIHSSVSEPWKVTLVDTGLETLTGGRIKRVQKYIGNEPFLLTYGDGVCDVNINKVIEFHKNHGKLATITAVRPEGKFGILDINEDKIESFREKSMDDTGFANGGFMVLQPEVIDYIKDDNTSFECEPIETIAKDGQLMAYKHYGFWQCMDTMRDKDKLEAMWKSKKAPWKVW